MISTLDRYRKSIENCFKNVKDIILVCSGKGGVGKTFIATGLAWYLSDLVDVGLLDLDLYGFSTHRFLGLKIPIKSYEEEKGPIQVRTNLHYFSPSIFIGDNPLPIRGMYREKAVLDILSSIAWNTDVVIIDMPPGTGEEVIIPCRYLNTKSLAIVVTLMEPVSIKVTERLIEILRNLNIRIMGLIFNMTHIGDINLFRIYNESNINVDKICEIPYIPCVLASIANGKPPFSECSELRQYFKPIIDRVLRSVLQART